MTEENIETEMIETERTKQAHLGNAPRVRLLHWRLLLGGCALVPSRRLRKRSECKNKIGI